MNAPNFPGFDLNLLRVFLALLDERSGTQAGRRLGLSQSAVSHSLNRLRYLLGDPLFVRSSSGMQPTQRAIEIAPQVRLGLAQIEAALAPKGFVPAESTRRFRITATAYPSTVILPDLIERFRRDAPHAEIRILPPSASLVDELDTGRTDLTLGVFGRVPERFDLQPVFRDRLVWVMREDHPMAHLPLTLERLGELQQILVGVSDAPDIVQGSIVEQGLERRVVVDDRAVAAELEARGMSRKTALTLPDIHAALAVVARSDLVTAAPSGLVSVFARALRLRVMEPPYPSPGFEMHALWRRDNDGPALRWLLANLQIAAARFFENGGGLF